MIAQVFVEKDLRKIGYNVAIKWGDNKRDDYVGYRLTRWGAIRLAKRLVRNIELIQAREAITVSAKARAEYFKSVK